MDDRRPSLLRIGTLHISGNGLSRAEARRLADALPGALERAAAAWPDEAPSMRGKSQGQSSGLADRIARRIVAAAVARSRVEGGGSR
jgi:hypothetical protein